MNCAGHKLIQDQNNDVIRTPLKQKDKQKFFLVNCPFSSDKFYDRLFFVQFVSACRARYRSAIFYYCILSMAVYDAFDTRDLALYNLQNRHLFVNIYQSKLNEKRLRSQNERDIYTACWIMEN